MKMQIAFRETNAMRHGHRVAMAVGVIEVGPEDKTDYEEKGLVFRFDFIPGVANAVAASTHWPPRELESDYGHLDSELQTGTLEGLLTTQIERAIPNETHNADLILRQTEVPPSVEGGRVFAFSGFVHVRPEQTFTYSDIAWYESQPYGHSNMMIYAGRSGIERRASQGKRDMSETMRGDAMSGFLRAPLWGFGSDAYSLPGTMRLSMYHKMDRYRELFFSERSSLELQQEFDTLKEEMRFAGLDNLARDSVFQEFARQMHEKYPELVGNKPMTGEQQRLYSEKAGEVIRLVKEAEDNARAYGR